VGQEIERKFLVKGEPWLAAGEGVPYRQGYLCLAPERTVRVRLAGEKGFLTVKGLERGGVRSEYEYPIPADEALSLLEELCERPLIEKVRYRLSVGGRVWELDVFAGENEGLVLAEVELSRPDETVALPDWAGREVTGDPRYFNASLVRQPFAAWRPR
jgi:CYTH domain-containing protein